MMIELSDLCAGLKFDSKGQAALAPYWEQLSRNTTDEFPFFLKREFYEKFFSVCKIPAECLVQMHEVSKLAEKESSLARYAAMFHYALYQAEPGIPVTDFPSLDAKLGDSAGIFPLMVAMSVIPKIREAHTQLNLPEHFLTDGLAWIGETMSVYGASHDGKPGILSSQLYWLRLQAEKRLFRIGRFEYLTHPWLEMLPAVYRSRKTGAVKAFCREGWQFDAQGYRLEDLPEETPAYTTNLSVCDGKIRGTEIARNGSAALGTEITLEEPEWEPLCSPWDMIPSIHIPGGGGMTMEKFRQSLKDAKIFFREYLHTDIKAFVCESWILNPAWRKLLPESNLAAFQRVGYNCPAIRSQYRHGLFFVYGDADCDPRKCPQKTSLHKAFCHMADEKIPFALGSMFLPVNELELTTK